MKVKIWNDFQSLNDVIDVYDNGIGCVKEQFKMQKLIVDEWCQSDLYDTIEFDKNKNKNIHNV
jgi:hypothetical protein